MMNYKTVITNIFFFTVFLGRLLAQDLVSSFKENKNLKQHNLSIFSLSTSQYVNKSRFLRFSVICGYRDGISSTNGVMTEINKDNGTTRFYMYNVPLQEILTRGRYKSNKVLLEVKNPNKYRYDVSQGSLDNWIRNNSVCFELMLPSNVTKMSLLDEELSRLFKVSFGLQRRLVNSLVLYRVSNGDRFKTKNIGEPSYNSSGKLNNVSIDKLSNVMYNNGFPPMVNETNIVGNVDLNLKIDSNTDLATLKNELIKYDLDLKLEKREVEMFVISESK